MRAEVRIRWAGGDDVSRGGRRRQAKGETEDEGGSDDEEGGPEDVAQEMSARRDAGQAEKASVGKADDGQFALTCWVAVMARVARSPGAPKIVR